jgi:hypothetical protein
VLFVGVGAALFVASIAREAELVVEERGLLLVGEGAEARLVGAALMRGCHELARPAETLVLALLRRPCTSLLVLQAR